MTIELPKLPYAHDALAPHISKETLHYHYNKHHKAYVDDLNKLIKDTEFEHMEVDEIIRKAKTGPIFNCAAQDWNHTFYWYSMCPAKDFEELKEGKLLDAIKDEFKSLDAFKKEFTTKGKKLFGSGWTWLVGHDGKVSIETSHNAHGPSKGNPLLVCDVWEHAYYLDTQNERPKYIENWFKVVNWDFAQQNFGK